MNEPIDPDATASGVRRPVALVGSATAPAAARASPRVDAQPSRIGRFQVLERAGRGAMGVVYAAYDPELDRKVAIKVVLADVADSTDYAERLRREARAMARVVHPNVVAVHDVGLHEGRPFIAMDFVAGADLRAYLRRERPPWQVVLELFLQAARGLAAAHAAEVIHRDFKPDNVLVAITSGQRPLARVADFGLAAASGRRDGDDIATSTGPTLASGAPLYTRSGAGTPAYMAAERWAGLPATAASDQFSFCVALYEALAGTRPFLGDTLPALMDAIVTGRREPLREATAVPRWIWIAIARGLATDPAARHPSMDALVTALLADPRRRRRRIAAAGLGALAIVGSFVGVQIADARARSRCERDADDVVATFWSAERQRVLARAFGRIDAAHASEAWGRIEHTLGNHAERLRNAQRELCIAHEVEHTIDDDLAARRADCLDVRRLAAEVLVTELEAVAPRTVALAPETARGLPLVGQCEDTRTLYERPALPDDPELRARIRDVRREIVELRTRRMGSASRDARADAAAVVAAAEEIGDPSTTAEALMELASQQGLARESDAAEAAIARAIEVASRGHDAVFEADAWLMMLWLVGEREPARIDDLVRGAAAAIDRVADNTRLHAKLDSIRGSLAAAAGDYDGAIALEEHAIALWEATPGDFDPVIARVQNNLGWAHHMRGDIAEARACYERALALKESMMGPSNPELATTLHNLGMLARQQHDLATARAQLERALALTIASVGADHPRVANVLSELAGTLVDVGERDAAIAAAERGLAILAQAKGDHAALRTELQRELARARG